MLLRHHQAINMLERIISMHLELLLPSQCIDAQYYMGL